MKPEPMGKEWEFVASVYVKNGKEKNIKMVRSYLYANSFQDAYRRACEYMCNQYGGYQRIETLR